MHVKHIDPLCYKDMTKLRRSA